MTNLGPYERNGIYCGKSEELMTALPDGCIDLTVTSPPYDNLRTYNGFTLDWHEIIRQLYRVTKLGGVVVWVVADATVNGSETGTSFKQALWAMDCGFNLHDTMIYKTSKPPMSHNRYEPEFEYMFIFSKGNPSAWNPIHVTKRKVETRKKAFHRNRKDNGVYDTGRAGNSQKRIKGNIWEMHSGAGANDEIAFDHSAVFPEALARDHILSWSNKNDLCFDPFCGSGTTLKMCVETGRDFLGFDISQEYVELSKRRVMGARIPLPLDL